MEKITFIVEGKISKKVANYLKKNGFLVKEGWFYYIKCPWGIYHRPAFLSQVLINNKKIKVIRLGRKGK